MPIYLGSNAVKGSVGSSDVKEIYLGSTLVYQNLPPYTAGADIMLDGIKNTANGHSNITLTWTDLSGNGNNASISFGSTDAWGTNGLSIQNNGTRVRLSTELFTSNFTMEFCVRLSSLYNYGTLVRAVNQSSVRDAWITSGGDTVLRVRSAYDTSDTNLSISALYTIAFTRSGNTQKTYINGVLKDTFTRTVSSGSDNSFDIFASSVADNRHIKGYAYAFRHYSSVLSAAELLRNYNVDYDRFI